MVEEILRIIFPESFASLKVKLFFILITGVIIDIGLKVSFLSTESHGIKVLGVELPGTSLSVVIICSLLFVFLIAVDFIIIRRKQSFQKKLFELLADPNIDEGTRLFIMEHIRHERG